jgi:hypothetical protein
MKRSWQRFLAYSSPRAACGGSPIPVGICGAEKERLFRRGRSQFATASDPWQFENFLSGQIQFECLRAFSFLKIF